METAFTVGEEELCCLVVADHHERRQTNKRLSEFYDELFALYGGKLCKKTFVLMVQSWIGYQLEDCLYLISNTFWFLWKHEACINCEAAA